MGENLVLNLESRGFRVSVFNRTTAVTEKFASGRAKDKNIVPTKTLEEFARSLRAPERPKSWSGGRPVDAGSTNLCHSSSRRISSTGELTLERYAAA